MGVSVSVSTINQQRMKRSRLNDDREGGEQSVAIANLLSRDA